MNPSQAIKEQLIALATIAGKDLNAIALNAYAEALSDLDPNEVLRALRDWIRTSKGFPYPSDIREKVMPELTDEDNAREVAVIIQKTISKRGRDWGHFQNGIKVYDSATGPHEKLEDAMKADLGDLATAVVHGFGGWTAICNFNDSCQPSAFQAQIRDYAKTVSKKAKRDEIDDMPALPASGDVKQLIQQTFDKGAV